MYIDIYNMYAHVLHTPYVSHAIEIAISLKVLKVF